jgi:hypothetical protein
MKVTVMFSESKDTQCLCDSYEFNEGSLAVFGLRGKDLDVANIQGLIFIHELIHCENNSCTDREGHVGFKVKYKGILNINEAMEIEGYEFKYSSRIKGLEDK